MTARKWKTLKWYSSPSWTESKDQALSIQMDHSFINVVSNESKWMLYFLQENIKYLFWRQKKSMAFNVYNYINNCMFWDSGLHFANKSSHSHRTALHWACVNGHAEVVTFLVDRKCQLDVLDGENRTPLMKVNSSQFFSAGDRFSLNT